MSVNFGLEESYVKYRMIERTRISIIK